MTKDIWSFIWKPQKQLVKKWQSVGCSVLRSITSHTLLWLLKNAKNSCLFLSVLARREQMLSLSLMQSLISTAPEGNLIERRSVTGGKPKNNPCLFSAGLPLNTVTLHLGQHKPQTFQHSPVLSPSPFYYSGFFSSNK